MTQSTTQLANRALSRAGCSARLNSFDNDTSLEAKTARDHYETLRDSLMREYLWSFAKKRVELSRLAATPVSGYDYAYGYPSDFLRIISVHPFDRDQSVIRYKPETIVVALVDTPCILANSDTLFLRYVRQVTAAAQFSADFYDALAWRLAVEFATGIKKDNKQADWAMKQFGAQISIAKSTNAIEDWPERYPDGSWSDVRDHDGHWGSTSEGWA